jgi:hypothetical protein
MLQKTPLWYYLLVAILFAALFYVGMVRPFIPLSQNLPIDPSYIDMNQYVGEKNPPGRFYATVWGDMDFVEGFLFLFLGLVCFVLGLIRALNKLECRRIFLIAAFSVLFAMMSLVMTDYAAQHFSNEFRFYVYWITFFGYPLALFLHYYDCLHVAWQKWLWLPVALCAAYGAAAFVMYFIGGLPFDMPERLYTYISSASGVIYVIVGSFAARDKSTSWYIRGILLFSLIYSVRLLILMRMDIHYSFHNEYRIYLLVVTSFMTCYLLFANTRELVKYKSGMQMMEIKNEFMLENYHTLESYFTQIAQMKHETQHHLLAIRELSEKGEYERLLKYLSAIQGDYMEIEEPIACGNRIIQAILGHAARRARELGFEIEFEILPLSALAIPDADLVSLFMNLLDNALESCAHIPDAKDRWIKVRLKSRPPYLCLSVTNVHQGKIDKAGDSYKSTKVDHALHGQGIEIVRRLTEKHNGLSTFEHTENTFSAEIALPVE